MWTSSVEREWQKLLYFAANSLSLPEEMPKHKKKNKKKLMADSNNVLETDGESVMGVCSCLSDSSPTSSHQIHIHL